MKVLNRPMFRYGGPIKEGIMSGIKEPRRGYNQGNMVFPADAAAMGVADQAKAFENIFQTILTMQEYGHTQVKNLLR